MLLFCAKHCTIHKNVCVCQFSVDCIVVLQAFGEVLSNLLDIRNDRGWEDLEEDDPTMGSELLLDNAEDFGLLLATSLGEGEKVVVSGDNICKIILALPVFNQILLICSVVLVSIMESPNK